MKNNEIIKNIESSFKMENMTIDSNTKMLLENYFDGKFTSEQVLDAVKNNYFKK